jgi:HlyD family secretion protein
MKSIAVLFACLCLSGLAGCSRKADDSGGEATVTPVEIAVAKRANLANVVTAGAVLFPLKQATIVPKISAPVQRFLVQRGDHVKEGQMVAVLEGRDLAAGALESKQLYEQAVATYENTTEATMPDELTRSKDEAQAAEETLDAAQKVYEGRVKLYKEGAIAQKLVEDAKVAQVQAQATLQTARQHLQSLQSVGQSAQLKAAKAQVNAAEAHYQSSDAQVSYTQVRSPMNGVVSDRPLNVGEMASSGSALLTVVDISRVVARANIPVQSAADIRPGQAADITGGKITLKGKVTVVSPAVDPNTTTIQIWVEAANPGERLKLGTTAQVSIAVGEETNTVVVPSTALLASDEGGEKVMLVGKDSLAHDQKVTVGIRAADQVQILDGLKGGEQVIVSGGLGLDDNSNVKVGPASSAADDKDPANAGTAKDKE